MVDLIVNVTVQNIHRTHILGFVEYAVSTFQIIDSQGKDLTLSKEITSENVDQFFKELYAERSRLMQESEAELRDFGLTFVEEKSEFASIPKELKPWAKESGFNGKNINDLICFCKKANIDLSSLNLITEDIESYTASFKFLLKDTLEGIKQENNGQRIPSFSALFQVSYAHHKIYTPKSLMLSKVWTIVEKALESASQSKPSKYFTYGSDDKPETTDLFLVSQEPTHSLHSAVLFNPISSVQTENINSSSAINKLQTVKIEWSRT